MRPKAPDPVKLVVSILTGEHAIFNEVIGRLQDRFGQADFISGLMEFTDTDYYKDEMGGGLKRKLASFERLIDIEELPEIKTFTNGIEDGYLVNGNRRVNIDPGYLSLEKFVLASCKNFSHRIYLGKGVFADLTLLFIGTDFKTLEWTYPDYRESGMKAMLREIRKHYARQLGKGFRDA